MNQLVIGTALGALTTLGLTTVVPSQDEEPEPPSMMELMALGRPGPEHQQLAEGVGEWTSTMSFRFAPGMPATEMTADASLAMVLGGRWLLNRTTGQMMGQSMELLSYMGFDRRSEEWVLVQLDTGGTYFITARGKENPETGFIEMYGEDESPWGTERYRIDFQQVGPDELRSSVSFYEQGGKVYDPPFEQVTVVTRRKVD